MTHSNYPTPRQIHRAPLSKRMIQGAVIGLLLISLFLWSAYEPHPDWSKFWMVKPLVIVPFAGAMGGLFYFLMDHLRYQGGWKAVVAMIISVVGMVFALWIGSVLGLNGTYWH